MSVDLELLPGERDIRSVLTAHSRGVDRSHDGDEVVARFYSPVAMPAVAGLGG